MIKQSLIKLIVSILNIVQSLVDRVAAEPALVLGFIASVVGAMNGGASFIDALPLASGLVTRHFVSPRPRSDIYAVNKQ